MVGVVDDMRQGANSGEPTSTFGGVLDPPQAEIFLPHRQWPFPIDDLIVIVRSSADPAALATNVRALIGAEDPTLPVDSIMTMEDRVAASLAGPRSYAVFLVGFALCALVIAGRGTLRGAVVHDVAADSRDRSADGARCTAWRCVRAGRSAGDDHHRLSGWLSDSGLRLFLSQSLSTLLYGISTRDALSFLLCRSC